MINSRLRCEGLAADAREFQTVADSLAYHVTSLEGHLESVNVLERKVRGISDLVRAIHPAGSVANLDCNSWQSL